MSSCTTTVRAPARLSPLVPARQLSPTSAIVDVAINVVRRPAAALAAFAGVVLSLVALTLVLRGSPVLLVRGADASMWHPGDGFDLSAGRALVEGLEVAAAALGLVGKLRLATLTVAFLGLALCLLHA
jgi:hypothetical protein